MKTNYSASTRKDLEPQMPNIMTVKIIKGRILTATKRSKIAVFEAVDIETGKSAYECYHADIYYTVNRIKNNDRHYVGSYYGRKGEESFIAHTKL
tara:strand:- start:276 stop:560 length:285 start_codon:yes stop_codon:yes gene_type:complete